VSKDGKMCKEEEEEEEEEEEGFWRNSGDWAVYIYIAGHGWSVGKEELGVVNNGRVVNCKSAGW
jgi:hypothetical protein